MNPASQTADSAGYKGVETGGQLGDKAIFEEKTSSSGMVRWLFLTIASAGGCV